MNGDVLERESQKRNRDKQTMSHRTGKKIIKSFTNKVKIKNNIPENPSCPPSRPRPVRRYIKNQKLIYMGKVRYSGVHAKAIISRLNPVYVIQIYTTVQKVEYHICVSRTASIEYFSIINISDQLTSLA